MGNAVEMRFITDEDVPRSTARVLRDAGFDAVDVQDVGKNLSRHLAIVEVGKVRLRA